MILICYLISFVFANVPKQYKDLIDEALKNSRIKVPKELRKETKYPGVYKNENYQFKLLKTLTSSHTNDIKGFAIKNGNLAIVKRKQFSIKDDFVFIDPSTQSIYKLNQIIFSYDNIIVYQSIKTNIFHFMTNFELHSNTNKNINLGSPKKDHNPHSYIDAQVKWDKENNRPELMNYKDTDIQFGFGTNSKILLNSIFKFDSIWDVKIAISISMESYIGGEFVIPDDTDIEIPEQVFYEVSIPLPRLNFSMKFLDLDINFCFNFNFDVKITNMNIEIPVGFDLFKGYKMIASKYFEITPFSVLNPNWNIDIVNLPEVNSITDTAKAITESSFTARFQLNPYFSLDINVGDVPITLQFGLKFPLVFDFNFDSQKCMFPYLAAAITFPFEMHYYFSGIQIDDFDIISECENDMKLFELKIGPFCIGGSETFMEENDNFIQIPSETAFHITCTNFTEKRKEGVEPVLKQIRFSIRDGAVNSKILDQRFYPYTYYDKGQYSDVVNVVHGIPLTGTMQWILNYKGPVTGLRLVGTSVSYMEFFKLYFVNNHTSTLYVSLLRDNEDKELDVTNFTVITEKCQMIEPGKVFIRKWKYISFIPDKSFKGQYSMIYFTPEGKLKTNNAHYLSNCMANSDFEQVQNYIETNENYDIHLISIDPFINIKVADLDIYLNYVYDNKIKNVLLGSYTISELKVNGTIYTAKILGLEGISFKSYVPKSMNSTISVSGKVILENSTVFDIDEVTVFDDNMTDQNVTLNPFSTAVIGATKITPAVTADCSASSLGITPAQEILAEKIDILDDIMSNQISIHFNENEMFKILHIEIPDKYIDSLLGIYTASGNVLAFLYKENKTIYNENFFYFEASTKVIEIPLRRSENKEKTYSIQIEYFKLGSSKLVVLDNTQGYDIEFNDDIQRAFIMPTIKGISSISWKGLKNKDFTDRYINIDDNSRLCFRNYSTGVNDVCTFFMSYSYISDSQPSITIDLTYLKPLLDENGYYSFVILCKNGKEIMAQAENGDAINAPIIEGKATLNFTEVGEITFYPICNDLTGKMCLIEYEAPLQTGYHLLRYPNRDGISTTGAGFLAEIIPVIYNQSFKYYKTYYGAVMKVREYSNKAIDVTMTIVDDYITYTRNLCLVETNNQNAKIPFSRKYFAGNMESLLDIFGIKKENFDLNKLETDIDGCLIIHVDTIGSDDIKEPPNEVCDLPVANKIEVDYSQQEKNFVEKSAKRLKAGAIAGIVIGCILGVSVIVVIIVYIVKVKA